MEQHRRSRTVEIPAILRALHQTIDDDPKILTDPIAPRLIAADDQGWLASLLDHPFASQWRAGFALRARYVENCLGEGVRAADESNRLTEKGLSVSAVGA